MTVTTTVTTAKSVAVKTAYLDFDKYHSKGIVFGISAIVLMCSIKM